MPLLRWTISLCLLTPFTAVAQQPAPVSQAEIRLEAKDGQTQFKLGDIIPLELVFRDPAFPDVRSTIPPNKAWMPIAGQKTVNSTNYNDLADDVTITPATGWFKWQGRSGHDYLSSTPVDATGIRLPLILNQGYVFRDPGHYEISVTTHRMGPSAITTNTLGIDITARSEDEEAALVRTLDATLAGSKGKVRQQAALQLAYLPGDAAARSKVRWLLTSNQTITSAMSGGLAATHNQTLQLQLLKAAWVDPTHAPDGTLQWSLKRAEMFSRGLSEPGFVMWGPRTDNADTKALAAEYGEDLERLIATLPQRTGDVRRDTAYYLMEDNELSSAQLARVKPVALEEFPHMVPLAQAMLIETRWNAIRDTSLAPSLKAMIESNAQNSDPASAVQRLVEIDESESRPYVVEMICRAQRGLLLDKLNGVKEDRLPEVDECLTALLAKGERRPHDFDWEQAAQRAARFATPAILPAVKAVWTDPSQDASMLAILLREAPAEALALLEREPNIDWYPTNKVYEALHHSLPPEVLTWLRSPKAPKNAVYLLAQYGEATDRQLLEQRLDDLRKEWRGRASEMVDAQPATPAYLAKSEEQELISSLFNAKAWTLTVEEKERIAAACVSDWCQRYAPHPQPTH